MTGFQGNALRKPSRSPRIRSQMKSTASTRKWPDPIAGSSTFRSNRSSTKTGVGVGDLGRVVWLHPLSS